MANPGRNEGMQVLDDFICEAISSPEVAQSARQGRGVNSGLNVFEDSMVRDSSPQLSAEVVAEWRRLSTHELLTLIRRSGSELGGQVLLIIHEIAVERLGERNSPPSEDALDLSREVMLVAVRKCA